MLRRATIRIATHHGGDLTTGSIGDVVMRIVAE